MDSTVSYCPMVGKSCVHEPMDTKPNSYFLIEPFDNEKEQRENAIERALKKYYGPNNYELRKSDSCIHLQSNFCDICRKIKSSQYCIADISGELYKIIDNGSVSEKVFLRPNVAFELGLAYGFNRPSLILYKELGGQHQIPSDLHFIRYIDISAKNWLSVSQKLLDRLRSSAPIWFMMQQLGWNERLSLNNLIKDIESAIYEKGTYRLLKGRTFKINQILYRNRKLIGIIRDGINLAESIYFKMYIVEDEIAAMKGTAKVFYVDPTNGLAQIEFYSEKENEDYWSNVAQVCLKIGKYVPGEHRLEMVIPEYLKQINIEEMKELLKILNKIRG